VRLPTTGRIYDAVNRRGEPVSGLMRLGQKFLLELLTIQGSVAYFPARGCHFMSEIEFGSTISPSQITNAFGRALLTITANLQSAEYLTDPTIELFENAVLNSVHVGKEEVYIYITVYSVGAGTVQTAARIA